ncbi:MAG: hypothetical protein ACI9XC_001026 [Gammaproteobacteria bacterium]|jgi:hypothetical protein
MVKNTPLRPLINDMPNGINSPIESTNKPVNNKSSSNRREWVISATFIILTATLGIQLSQNFSDKNHASISIRFNSMYQNILSTDIALLESVLENDQNVKIPSLENHALFINFGQILSSHNTQQGNETSNAKSNLLIIQNNYEFLAQNLIPYDIAYSLIELERVVFPRNNDPLIFYNNERILFSEYTKIKDDQITKRKEQLIGLTDLLHQYFKQYQELSILINAGNNDA